MSKKFFHAVVLFLLVADALEAQDTWSLSQCISYAIENNIGLRKMGIAEKMAEENFRQSRRNFLPGISASTNGGFSFGRSIDPVTNGVINNQFFNNSYGLSASMTLFNGFMMINQVEYQKYIKRAAEQHRLNATDDLAFQVMNSYFDVLYFKGILEIAESQVEASGINLKRVKSRLNWV
jgi:outer membrane protein